MVSFSAPKPACGCVVSDVADVFSTEKRSWVMSRIRGKNTRPEIAVRSLLHRMGYRFTVNGPHNRKLPGHPDIVLPKWKTVVFVHGCFWHAHQGCKDFRLPKTRTEWWRAKLEGNRQRDQGNVAELEAAGWNVVVVWACELKNHAVLDALERRLHRAIAGTHDLKVAEDDGEYGAGDD